MTISARVFIHPRCVQGPGAGALAACLQERGYDVSNVGCSPADSRGRYELVRISEDGPLSTLLTRLDGTSYQHIKGQVASSPEVA